MHRESLFFDPLHDKEGMASEPTQRHRPDAEQLQAQRECELARVQDELRKLAQGFGLTNDGGGARARRRRRRPVVER